MTTHCEDELASLARQISAKQFHIESQAIVIEVLERDGHDMTEQRKRLANERSDLATKIAQELRLIETK
ncbi:hypothetical protein [Bradyrhizobium sp. NBAIM32]|uniref:hypothetical protein n=1 Tax=Bradyrhizobium sp. NBAIM32 TaxID=2793809 RepID=UPI001CD72A13|nr:hypothetical protein [Bradyrhizobium sp. NBAIM32]